MCPLLKQPCTDQCRWFMKLFIEINGKEQYGCVLQNFGLTLSHIENYLESINKNLDFISTSMPINDDKLD